MTRHELHLHLYGCLAAEDVWELGRSRWEDRKAALHWYADEYERAWQRRPQWEAYWTHPEGLSLLRSDFAFREPAHFDRFQACFNLVIALFPLSPSDNAIIRFVLKKMSERGLHYAELRIPFGMTFAKDAVAIDAFLTMLAQSVRDFESSEFIPRIAITLPRNDEALAFQYQALRTWLATHTELAFAIAAIDFCGVEEGSPPKTKRQFLQTVREDNRQNPTTALAVLYHVGESYRGMSLDSAIRWVWEAHEYGAHRLGHCIALGVDPSMYLGESYEESIEEQRDHQHWLVNNAYWLGAAIGKPRAIGNAQFLYTEERVEELRKLQDAVMEDLKRKGTIIEVCPSSNRLIGKISNSLYHPLPRFLRNGLKIVVASDDPGIFETHLLDEEAICRETYGMTKSDLHNAAKTAESSIAERLVRRV